MRECGLRIEEALAVSKEDFIEKGLVLRVTWQTSRDGRKREPLKHRKTGEYRDVPVPSWLWEMVKDMPDGPLMPFGIGAGVAGAPERARSPIKAHAIRGKPERVVAAGDSCRQPCKGGVQCGFALADRRGAGQCPGAAKGFWADGAHGEARRVVQARLK